MDILLTGNLNQISTACIKKLKDYRCIMYGEGQSKKQNRNYIDYSDCSSEEVSNIYSTYHFNTVVFFSHALDGAVKIYDEFEKLEQAVYECKKHNIPNFIYILTNDFMDKDQSVDGYNSRAIMLSACTILCESFSEKMQIHFSILYCPYIYSMKGQNNQLVSWIQDAVLTHKVSVRGSDYNKTDFLCDEDLGDLLARMLDEPQSNFFQEMYLTGRNGITFKKLEKTIKDSLPDIVFTYLNTNSCIPAFHPDERARKEYDWTPMHVLTNDIRTISNRISTELGKENKKMRRKKLWAKVNDRFRIIIESIIFIIVAQFLNQMLKNNSLLNFIDFRIIYVVLMGTTNGMKAGILAACLASVGHTLESIKEVPWQVIFYNINNWFPYAVYILLGTISGYTCDKKNNKIHELSQKSKVEEDKYNFLLHLYDQAIESKDDFINQIIGYQNSFGKLYSIVKRLDTLVPDEIAYEAVEVLEEMMDNESIAIYTISEDTSHARLSVCSGEIKSILKKSIKCSEYQRMFEYIQKGETFVNREGDLELPSMAIPIIHNKKVIGGIVLWRATSSQMNMENLNRFQIIGNLITDALVRAIEFRKVSTDYVEDTMILNTKAFMKLLQVKKQMAQKDCLDYVMLQIKMDETKRKEVSDQLQNLVRTDDNLGLGEDGQLYLLLNQTTQSEINSVTKRLDAAEIIYRIMGEGEMIW